MDSQNNNLHNQNLNNSIKIKKESSTQTLISSIHLNNISNEKNLMSNEEFLKNSKETWKQMSSSLRNIYFSNIENKNKKEN